MEKYIKNLSILHLVLSTMFFISMTGLLLSDSWKLPTGIVRVLGHCTQVLMFAVPVAYLIVFVTSMFSIFRRVMSIQLKMNMGMNNLQKDMFPALWFVLSSVFFIIFFLFINMISPGA